MNSDPRRLRDDDAALAALLDAASIDEATDAETSALDARMLPLLAPPAAAATGSAVAGAASIKLYLLAATLVVAAGIGAYRWQPWRAPATPPSTTAQSSAARSAEQASRAAQSSEARSAAQTSRAVQSAAAQPPSASAPLLSRAPAVAPAAAPASAPRPAAPPPAAPSAPPAATIAVTPPSTVEDATSAAPTGVSTSPPDELTLLMRARAELADQRGVDALGTIALHARSFPRSAFAPERDALRIEALAQSGRSDDARIAFARHVTQYPSSPYRARLSRLFEDESAAAETNSR